MSSSAVELAHQHLNAGRVQEAGAVLQQHVRRHPKDARAMAFLALVWATAGDSDRAAYSADRAVAMAPTDPEVVQLFAGTMLSLGRTDAAETAYRRVLSGDEDRIDTLLGLATLLSMRDAHAEVEDISRRVLAAAPHAAPAAAMLAAARLARGDAADALQVAEAGLREAPDDPDLLFARAGILNSVAGADPAVIAEAHRRFGGLKAALSGGSTTPTALASPARRPAAVGGVGGLRVGFVSSDFRRHPVAHFIRPLLESLDRNRLDPVAFYNHADSDAVTDQLRPLFAEWHQILPLSDEAAAELVRRQRIDVLIDLNGLTAGERLGVLARRPAPTQATWLGYPNTTGVPGVEYRLVDAVTDPPGGDFDSRCTERLVRLEGCFICYGPPKDAPDPASRPAAGPVVFGSFNALHKLSPDAVSLWTRIVNAVPGSRLLLKAASLGEELTRAQIAARFAAAGLPLDRLELLGWTPTEPLRLYERVDIALDSFPYNGTTTTCDALWMGVPVITLAGITHAGRVGASLLIHAGLADLVAADADEYARIAVALANDAGRRSGWRSTLRRQVHGTIADGPSFARRFERAIEGLMAAGR